MNCEKIQELILTDYSDNELKHPIKRDVEAHLKSCQQCKEFEIALRKTAITPFQGIEDVQPPEFVWHRIKEDIQKDTQKETSFVDTVVERLKKVFFLPSPALVYASITIIILSAVVFRGISKQDTYLASDYLLEQSEVLAYFNGNGTGVKTDFDGIGLEYDAENYFL
jgi:anti-sigma factor RsiW